MYSVKWKLAAQSDLADIIDYIDQFNTSAAANLRADIVKTAESLIQHTFLYRTGKVNGTREAVVHPNYIVVYKAGDAVIEILRVLHARQEYPT